MGWPNLNGRSRKRDSILSIDLGSRTTKAVHLARRGDGYALTGYVIRETPGGDKPLEPVALGEHLRSIVQSLDVKTRRAIVSLGVHDSILRNAEMPLVPVSEMRQMLRFGTQTYLQQDLPNHEFDCFVTSPRQDPAKAESGKPAGKFKVWVGAAPGRVMNDVQAALKTAGLAAESVTPGVLGPVNAFEAAFPEIFQNEVVALVDLGFKNTSISILNHGDLVMNRVVAVGGDRLTASLAELMNVGYSEAEGIKIGMPHEVEQALMPVLHGLGRELRASVDFFETQSDQAVSSVFLSGGAARSEFFIQSLQSDLMLPCKAWSPAGFLASEVPASQAADLEQLGPQLAVAIGAATTLF
jgi:type IV pilus assembly protein PilM